MRINKLKINEILSAGFYILALLVSFLQSYCIAVADPITYSDVYFKYGADSTIGVLGESYDSDNSYTLGGSYEINDNFFATSSYGRSNYDLKEVDKTNGDFYLTLWNIGVGTKFSISDGDTPIDLFFLASYENHRTKVKEKTLSQNYTLNQGGAGIKGGIRGKITDKLEFIASASETSYGKQFLERKGGLDSLMFDLGLAYSLNKQLDLTVNYITGELDYREIEGFAVSKELEIDRDELQLGVRYNF